jgi:hypothetical protein
MIEQIVLLIMVGIPAGLWVIIAIAGALPVFSFKNTHLSKVSTDQAGQLLKQIYAQSLVLDSEELHNEGFVPLGVFTAEGIPGQPKIITWEQTGEATWLCGYLLPNGQCQFDLVSLLAAAMLTTGSTKDGQLFPTPTNGYVQTFDLKTLAEFLEHHRNGLDFLSNSYGLIPDHSQNFADTFETSIREQGRFIRSLPLWIARIPWWYFTRRSSRHNCSIQQLYGDQLSF